jgi:Flp pilus assembly protein TadG
MRGTVASTLKRFRRDQRGGVVVMLALAIVPLIGMAGAAVDYSRANSLRGSLQKAADSAALVAAKGNGAFPARRQAALRTLSNQLAAHPGLAYNADVTQTMEAGRESGVSVTISSAASTTLLNVLGIRTIAVSVDATATSGRNEAYDVAFVLDTTGSMEGARLDTLKSATTALIDDFIERRTDSDQIRVSVIPFGQYVNVGMSNRNQPWIDVPSDYQTPIREECRTVQEVTGRTCERVWDEGETPRSRTCHNDGRPFECGSRGRAAGWVDRCTNVHGPNMVQQCSTSGGHWVRWNGCVGSRNFPNETLDANYAIRIPGLLGVHCGSPILEPTTDLALARSRINALTTAGETYIPAGLIWGWRALSTHAPIAARASQAGLQVTRHMILVTDGQNTRSPNYPHHDHTNGAEANSIMRTLCQNLAADRTSGIRLHTIAFEVTDPTVKQILEECSTANGGGFYDAGNASQLRDAMRAIGGQISKLRITS